MAASTTGRAHHGRINVYETSDYPIVLGESLKNEARTQSRFLQLRYNWEPQSGFSNYKGLMQSSNERIQLEFEDKQSPGSTFEYIGVSSKDSDDDEESGDKKLDKLALIFDPKKSVYVLERISKSLDMNLTEAHDQTSDEVRRHRQISSSSTDSDRMQSNGDRLAADQDEDHADPANPFDFRHFLSEAKEIAEKASLPTGARTPLAGSRTPMSGISSPSLGAGRFLAAGTPQFRPTPTSAPIPKKSVTSKPASVPAPKKPTPAKRKPVATKPSASQPLSSEVVTDSSDSDTQNVIVAPRPTIVQPKSRGHNRNTSSASMGRSPHIVVNDGALEIDMGSPPPESHRKSAFDFDLDAFRSQTHTPTLPINNRKPQSHLPSRDIEMKDQSEDEAEEARHGKNDDNSDMDDDVEDLALPSPRRKVDEASREDNDVAPSPPTPNPPPQVDEDEDDLEAELEAALGNEMNTGYDDESEVSEEE